MKKIIVLLSILLILPASFCFSKSDIDKTMTVPFNEKQLSDLTYVIEDTAYVKIYSALTLLDELKLYDDFQLLDNMSAVKNVKVFLNSFGGGMYAGFAIADQLKRIANRFEVSIYASGVVASAAVMVFVAVENRYATEDTFFMVHEISIAPTAAMGSSDVKLMNSLMDMLTARYVKNLVKHSNKTEEQWQKMLKNETWFSAQQALDWGLVKVVK
jgi:ATP-dependent protease ClpP protease subunit